MKGKVKKLEAKITELVAKLNKHFERLAASKLPAKLKRISAKSVPSWMDHKLNSVSLSFKPATSSI